MKPLLFLFLLDLILLTAFFFLKDNAEHQVLPVSRKETKQQKRTLKNEPSAANRLRSKATSIREFAASRGYSTHYSFLVDMRLPSGQKRFFVYDLQADSVCYSGMVAHGNCRSGFLEEAVFSNVPECGCSSIGKYKVGYPYEGQFGQAFKLHGLDSTNSNAFQRTIVLHAYDCVPDEEVYPSPICNSLGCPMVSYRFLDTLAATINNSRKPILLWIYN